METCSLPSCYYYGYRFARETPKKHSKRKASSSTHTTGKKRKISRFHCNVCITNYEGRNEFTSNPLEETDEVIEDCLRKYEDYIRGRVDFTQKLDKLESKTLDYSCTPEPRDVDVLVKLLEEKKIYIIRKKLEKAGLHVKEHEDLVGISKANALEMSQRFLAYASRLDRTNIFYFEPEMYMMLKKFWGGEGIEYWPAYTNSGRVYFIVGLYNREQPLGPFWDEQLNVDDIKHLPIPDEPCKIRYPPSKKTLLLFAQKLQTVMEWNMCQFKVSLKRSMDYHILHRMIAKRVGRVCGIDMSDHDLTKTRLIHVALAYIHHWPEDKDRDQELLDLAKIVVKIGHCEMEDHHPEYEVTGRGIVDVQKLFVDRIAVHLHKDKRDELSGWDVGSEFIPTEYKDIWHNFKALYGHVDLYDEVFKTLHLG